MYFFCNDWHTFRCASVCNAHFNFTGLFKFHTFTVVFKSFFVEFCKCTFILFSNDFFVSSNFVVVIYKFSILPIPIPFLLCTYSCIFLCITIILHIKWSK